MANLKLGKLPARHDDRTLKLSKYAAAVLPSIPDSSDWTTKVSQWGQMLNDRLGDCAIAAPGHQIMAMTSQATTLFTPPDSEILAGYRACGHYVDGDPSTDRGCNMLDVMNWWRRTGLAGHKTACFISIDAKSPSQIKAGVHLFGGVQFGVQLPAVAEQQFASGQPWKGPTNPKDLKGSWAVGSWGGHAVPGLKYDDQGVYVVTWGKVQLMTWQFIQDYADEAYVVVEPDWFAPDGKSPSGFDLWQLWADLDAITDGKHPVPPPPPRPVPVTPPPAPTPTPAQSLPITVAVGDKKWTGTVVPA